MSYKKSRTGTDTKGDLRWINGDLLTETKSQISILFRMKKRIDTSAHIDMFIFSESLQITINQSKQTQRKNFLHSFECVSLQTHNHKLSFWTKSLIELKKIVTFFIKVVMAK